MPYIDALFFSAGAATQSGLNTYVQNYSASKTKSTRIDVNTLNTAQQVSDPIGDMATILTTS